MNEAGMYVLKGYIAPGAPLNFELCSKEENGLRLVVGFTTNWFHKRTGVCFGERFHTDPYYRYKEIEKMHRYLCKTFPDIRYFKEHEAAQECATISGIYGTCPVSMAYGMKPIYQDNDWPAIHPKDQFTLEELENLAPISVADTAVGESLLRQIEIIGREWGMCDGYLNYQGTLSNAFKLLGGDALLYMLEEPESIDKVFSHVTQTGLNLMKMVQGAQRATGFPCKEAGLYGCISNCLANMISPALYEDMLLKYDRYTEAALELCGMHTCNWNVNKLLPGFAKMERIRYIDFSVHSDWNLVQEYLPQARKLVFFSPGDFMGHTDHELRTVLKGIASAFGSCDICLADMDLNTPDEQIIRFSKVLEEVNEML